MHVTRGIGVQWPASPRFRGAPALRQVVANVQTLDEPWELHNCVRGSVGRQHSHWPSSREDVDDDLLTGSPYRDIGCVIANRQIAEEDLIQKGRHHRLFEGDPPFTRVEAEPKTDLQHIKG